MSENKKIDIYWVLLIIGIICFFFVSTLIGIALLAICIYKEWTDPDGYFNKNRTKKKCKNGEKLVNGKCIVK